MPASTRWSMMKFRGRDAPAGSAEAFESAKAELGPFAFKHEPKLLTLCPCERCVEEGIRDLATEFNRRRLIIDGAPRSKNVADNLTRVALAADARQDLSPSESQTCHSSDDKVGTQTYPNNNIQLTYDRCPSNRQRARSEREGLGNGSAVVSCISGRAPKPEFVNLPSSKEAAQTSAERRWNKELLDRFRQTSLYATILEALDHDIQAAATQAEMQRVGAGVKYILQELIRRRALSAREI